MKYIFFSLIALITSNSNVSVMELTPLTREQALGYQEKVAELEKRVAEYGDKIKNFEERLTEELQKKHTNIPDAPQLIASAQLPTPPAPEKPQSFFKENKKALVAGGIGLGILTAGGIVWKLSSGNSSALKDYYHENVR